MKKKLSYFVNLSQGLKKQGKSIFDIGEILKSEGASLSLSVVSLNKIGFSLETIDDFLKNSLIWEDEKINLTDLFFEYIELDDDLI